MSKQTNVTNGEVPESSQNQSQSHSGEGQNPSLKEIEDRIRENLRAEYGRKSTELLEKLNELSSSHAELMEKNKILENNLSRPNMQNEDELLNIFNEPGYKPYALKIQREIEKSQKEFEEKIERKMMKRIYDEFVEDFLEDLPNNIKDEELKGKYDSKKLREELNNILRDGRYSNVTPIRRAKLAFKDFQERYENFKKAEQESKKNKEFSEDQGRHQSPKSLKEAFETGDTKEQMRLLGL